MLYLTRSAFYCISMRGEAHPPSRDISSTKLFWRHPRPHIFQAALSDKLWFYRFSLLRWSRFRFCSISDFFPVSNFSISFSLFIWVPYFVVRFHSIFHCVVEISFSHSYQLAILLSVTRVQFWWSSPSSDRRTGQTIDPMTPDQFSQPFHSFTEYQWLLYAFGEGRFTPLPPQPPQLPTVGHTSSKLPKTTSGSPLSVARLPHYQI